MSSNSSKHVPTFRQRQVLVFVADRIRGGLPPTIREICDHVGIKSTNGASAYLDGLERLGLITRGSRRAREIRLTADGRKALRSARHAVEDGKADAA